MSPDEVIKQLKEKLGVEISRATLLRYEKQKLIPEPERGGGGAGGRWTDYPEKTVAETYAAWSLMHGEYGDQLSKDFFGGKVPVLPPKAIQYIRLHAENRTANAISVAGAVKEFMEENNIPESDKDYYLANAAMKINNDYDREFKSNVGRVNWHIISAYSVVWGEEVKYAQGKMSE